MIGDTVLANPIWWGQFRLAGGARRVAWRTVVYAVAGVVGFGVACRFLEDLTLAQVADYALYFVGLAQLILILPVWGSRITKAIVSDVESRMMESHRLSPMTGLGAVIGYMVGPCLQIGCLCVINLVGGIVLCGLSGKNLDAWLVGHVYILFVAVFLWSGMALGSLCWGKGANAITAVFVALLIGAWRVVEFIPGLGLALGTEMIGYCGSVAKGGNPGALPAGAGLSVVVQVLVILLWMRGASRKFERPDRPAFSTEWASLAYAGWLVVALVGLARAEDLRLPMGILKFEAQANWQLVATLIASLLLMTVPLRSAAMERHQWFMQHRDIAGSKPLGEATAALVLSLVSAATIAWVPVWLATHERVELSLSSTRELLLWTTACVVLTALSIAALYGMACSSRWKKIDNAVVTYVVGLWILLPLADGMIQSYRESASLMYVARPTVLTACSPPGGLILAWKGESLIFWEGLILQAALCIGFVLWYWRAKRMAQARRASI